MYLRYSGSKLDIRGAVWRMDIFQEADEAFAVGELDPVSLQIEWPEKDFATALCGSAATLVLNSPSDRAYLDLYTVRPGRIRLDVYKDDALYWSGTLDPEFYEEPYERGMNYDVTLTFSDFGILERIPFDLSGLQTLEQLLLSGLAKSGVIHSGINTDFISTSFPDGTPLTLGSLSLPSENFFDEDGEASSYHEVLEGILKPLALRMVQRSGRVYIYDLNGLYTNMPATRPIRWNGTGSTLKTPSVFNNIRVTFSPYSSSKPSKELNYGDDYGPEWTNLGAGTKYNGGAVPAGMTAPECYSFYIDYNEDHRRNGNWDYNLVGFTIFRSTSRTKNTGLASIGQSNAFFRIQPGLGGSESEGVIVGFRENRHFSLDDTNPAIIGINPAGHPRSVAMTTGRIFLPTLPAADGENHYLRILMEMLCDPRYNPFENASDDGNEGEAYNSFKDWASHAFVPVAIVVYDENGVALCHYSNKGITQNGRPGDSIRGNRGTWENGDAAFGDAWLAWYDPDDLLEGTGLLGWKTNRQNFGKPWSEGRKVEKRKWYYTDKWGNKTDWWMFDSFKKAPDGQFIPYPPQGGHLEVRVYNGVYILDDTEAFSDNGAGRFAEQGLYDKIRWLLYKAPEISLVRRTLNMDEAETGDIEYSGVASIHAQEDLDIDTICGTAQGAAPSARGVYLRTSDGCQVSMLVRAGRTDHPEQLLIGTLYSQYAERKTALSGDVVMDSDGLALYTDDAQPAGLRFLMTGERQDVLMNNSEAQFVELRPDEYTGVEG